MATYLRTVFTVGELTRLYNADELVLQPKFQRRIAWSPEARAYLIDTILRGLPMPKVYLRRIISSSGMREVYEVVDGQQRLYAIMSFQANRIVLSRKHSRDFGSVTYQELDESVQRRFLDYEISVEVIEDATDREVWSMFERLNSYTLTLNSQEKRNAEFFGFFKQTAYNLAADETEFGSWAALAVFTDRQIARMREVEMTSDVLTAICLGIRDIVYLGIIYKDFDDDFPQQESVSAIFRDSIEFAVKELAPYVRTTRFKNASWFYSLIVAIADAMVGIPGGLGPTQMRQGIEISPRMTYLQSALDSPEPIEGLTRLKDALARATSHIPQRLVRHDYFFNMLTMSPSSWDVYLTQHYSG